jgi:hypothetical protein
MNKYCMSRRLRLMLMSPRIARMGDGLFWVAELIGNEMIGIKVQQLGEPDFGIRNRLYGNDRFMLMLNGERFVMVNHHMRNDG